jgi:hypothetical protein
MFQILSKFMTWSKIFGGVRVLTQREVDGFMMYCGETHAFCEPVKNNSSGQTNDKTEPRACLFHLSAQLHIEFRVPVPKDCFSLIDIDLNDPNVDDHASVPLSAGNDSAVNSSSLGCPGSILSANRRVSSC